MCSKWKDSLEEFINDMGPRPSKQHSVDRIDNTLGYYKENCRWATSKEQMNNQDRNLFVEYAGKRLTYAQWADELNLDWKLFKRRVDRLFLGKESVEPRGQQVVQKDKEGNTIDIFKSVKEASGTTTVTQAAIRKCLCKHNKSAGGFLWEYL